MNVVSRIEPAVATEAPLSTATQVLGAVVLIIELSIVALAIAERSWMLFLLPHLAIGLFMLGAIIVLDRQNLDTTQLQQLAILTFVTGPFGTAAAILAAGGWLRTRKADLQVWYNTIAPPEQAAVTLIDQIIDGRLVNDQSQLPRSFDSLLANGSPAEKRAVLAHLALENVDFPNALRIALRSPDPALRVQAAAVAAHQRDKARHRDHDGRA